MTGDELDVLDETEALPPPPLTGDVETEELESVDEPLGGAETVVELTDVEELGTTDTV